MTPPRSLSRPHAGAHRVPKARPAPRLPGALVPRVLLPAGLLSAAMLSSVPLAPAQAADPPPPPLATQQMLPATDTLRVFGRDVKSASGTVVAQIVNVLVNEAGEPRAAILDYGGFLGVGRRRTGARAARSRAKSSPA